MTIQTAVLIETLVALGADVRWATCNIFSTQDHAAAAVVVGRDGTVDAPAGTPVFAWKGETPRRVLGRGREGLRLRRRRRQPVGPTCCSTTVATSRCSCTSASSSRRPASCRRRTAPTTRSSRRCCASWPARSRPSRSTGPSIAKDIKGVSEETTTGVLRLYDRFREGTLLFPAINVNDSVTKSKFDNKYGCRHSLIDGLNRATDVMIGGKVAVVCGYGDVGKGSAESLRGQGARVIVTEIDPICALQAAMDGYEVKRLDSVVETADIFITTTGNFDIITVEHFHKMKHQAIVGNIGHFDNEINMAGLAKIPRHRQGRDQAAGPPVDLPGENGEPGKKVIVLSEGRLLNLGNATGHPSFVMSNSFTNQVLAQIELFTKAEEYAVGVTCCPSTSTRRSPACTSTPSASS